MGDEPIGTGLGTRIVDAIARSLGSKVRVLDRDKGTAIAISVKRPRAAS